MNKCKCYLCLFVFVCWNRDSFWTSPSALSPFKCPHLLHLPFPNRAMNSPAHCPLSLLLCVVRVILLLLKTATSQSLFLKQWHLLTLSEPHLKLWGKGSVVWLTLLQGSQLCSKWQGPDHKWKAVSLQHSVKRGVLSCPLEKEILEKD